MREELRHVSVEYVMPQIVLLHNFWSFEECESFIAASEQKPFEKAKINSAFGEMVLASVRNNDRLMYKDHVMADALWERLKAYAITPFAECRAIGLNEMMRVYRYTPGQKFKEHRDGNYARSEKEFSCFTFMIYLNDNFTGGETEFERHTVKPKQGTALMFLHELLHEGCEVKTGVKYVLRTDVMYLFEGETN